MHIKALQMFQSRLLDSIIRNLTATYDAQEPERTDL